MRMLVGKCPNAENYTYSTMEKEVLMMQQRNLVRHMNVALGLAIVLALSIQSPAVAQMTGKPPANETRSVNYNGGNPTLSQAVVSLVKGQAVEFSMNGFPAGSSPTITRMDIYHKSGGGKGSLIGSWKRSTGTASPSLADRYKFGTSGADNLLVTNDETISAGGADRHYWYSLSISWGKGQTKDFDPEMINKSGGG